MEFDVMPNTLKTIYKFIPANILNIYEKKGFHHFPKKKKSVSIKIAKPGK